MDEIKAIKKHITSELQKIAVAEEIPVEIQDRVSQRRVWENRFYELKCCKDAEEKMKGGFFEILDKCSDPIEIAQLKEEITKISEMDEELLATSMTNEDPQKASEAVIKYAEKRHAKLIEVLKKYSKWVVDPELAKKYIPFQELPAESQKSKNFVLYVY